MVQQIRKKQEAGFTLIEMMLVVAIIALILIVVGRGFQAARMNQQVNNAMTTINTIRAASAQYAILNNNYSGMSYDQLHADGLLPKAITENSNPWGGTLKLTTGTNTISIAISSIPKLSCEKFVKLFRQGTMTPETCAAGDNTITVTF